MGEGGWEKERGDEEMGVRWGGCQECQLELGLIDRELYV